jgi:D-sedoheptulose 7-phosphate isomerase
MTVSDGAHAHVAALRIALDRVEPQLERVEAWGRRLAAIMSRGGRLLAVGNGGSAAQAQHLTAELVGRYQDEREPLSAIALHAETSTLTALANDYPPTELFARQVRAHGRAGDALVAISTSGRSPNVVAAVEAGRDLHLATLALTGPAPNPLALMADGAVCVDAPSTATVQEVHQMLVHLLCRAVDDALADRPVLLAEARR